MIFFYLGMVHTFCAMSNAVVLFDYVPAKGQHKLSIFWNSAQHTPFLAKAITNGWNNVCFNFAQYEIELYCNGPWKILCPGFQDDVMTSKRFPHITGASWGDSIIIGVFRSKWEMMWTFSGFSVISRKTRFKIQSSSRWFARLNAQIMSLLCKWDVFTNHVNGQAIAVWKWIRNFTPHFITGVITYPHWIKS